MPKRKITYQDEEGRFITKAVTKEEAWEQGVFREIFETKKETPICPYCKSKTVQESRFPVASNWNDKWFCLKCGHRW